ncbi:MAG: M10 family metallopeptidase C-terminal domain-containing protein, partial [Pseudomonadota bacterium]
IDIAALQEVYGANTSHAGGDDIYRLDDANGPDIGYATIWDTGGFDTMLYQGARDVSIDLRAATLSYREGGGGFVSYAEGVHAGLTIAHGVVIEAAESGAGDDSLGGNGADNWLTAGAGDDTLRGHGGDDWLDGGTGGDFLNGGAGIDTVMFVNAAEGVKADLASGKGSRGEAAGDLYIGIEDLIGGRHTDDLRGDAAQNRIEGGNGADGLHGRQGDDELVGGGGSDRLYGNLGADLMTGGSGFDRFVYFAASDSGIGQQDRDRITDFEQGKDRMDLAHLFDRSETSRDDQLALIGGARFSSDAGELRYFQNRVAELTIVEADLDGDGSADLQIELAGLLTLVREDFLL